MLNYSISHGDKEIRGGDEASYVVDSELAIGDENKTIDVSGVISVINAIKVPRTFVNP